MKQTEEENSIKKSKDIWQATTLITVARARGSCQEMAKPFGLGIS